MIPESSQNTNLANGCRHVDRQLSTFYNCPIKSSIDMCKNRFCDRQGSKLNFELGGSKKENKEQCVAFVSDEVEINNYLIAACTLSKLHPANPTKCLEDQACRKCVDDVTDFPDELVSFICFT